MLPADGCTCAQVLEVPAEDLVEHRSLVEEYADETRWPKHLLVHYRWTVQHEVDVEHGLYMLFAAGREKVRGKLERGA